jgi:hypothetical protein
VAVAHNVVEISGLEVVDRPPAILEAGAKGFRQQGPIDVEFTAWIDRCGDAPVAH